MRQFLLALCCALMIGVVPASSSEWSFGADGLAFLAQHADLVVEVESAKWQKETTYADIIFSSNRRHPQGQAVQRAAGRDCQTASHEGFDLLFPPERQPATGGHHVSFRPY
jgi:hypothetical protein